ncbi:MAG: SDR family NAD(P)-dependent oxidoreductase [Polyangiales bacterium]
MDRRRARACRWRAREGLDRPGAAPSLRRHGGRCDGAARRQAPAPDPRVRRHRARHPRPRSPCRQRPLVGHAHRARHRRGWPSRWAFGDRSGGRGLSCLRDRRRREHAREAPRSTERGDLGARRHRPRSVGAALREVDARTGGYGVDLLLNAAGHVEPAPMDLVDDATWRRTFAVNAVGAMRVTRVVAQRMCDRGSGRIVNVSSVAGVMAFPFVGPYQASKFALEALSDALRQELHPFGVDVVLIEPSFIADGFAERVSKSIDERGEAAAHWRPLLPHLPSIEGRLGVLGGDAEEVASVVATAATTTEPAARFAAPWTASVAVRAEPWLPAAVTDRIFHELFALKDVGSRPEP